MTRIRILIVLLCLLLNACSNKNDEAPETKNLTVFAAASLTDAFEELGAAFEQQHQDVNVQFSFGGSSTLATQINEGASADIFASANQRQMESVADSIKGESQVFAQNKLVVIVYHETDLTTLDDLRREGIKLVLAAPEVPIRDYANTVLDNYGEEYKTEVLANLVSEEDSVRQVVVKVALGEGDAGIVYASDITADVADDLRVIPIPDDKNVIADYPIAALSDKVAARDFITFILSNDGQAILEKWGFSRVGS